jgi:hypothetical protein
MDRFALTRLCDVFAYRKAPHRVLLDDRCDGTLSGLHRHAKRQDERRTERQSEQLREERIGKPCHGGPCSW